MSDIAIELPDIPMPVAGEEAEKNPDTFESAFKFCFLGSGQAGCRIAEEFYGLGYRRVACVNSTLADLDPVKIPKENKHCVGGRGAGKDLNRGRQYMQDAREEILDLLRKSFDTSFDRVMVCVGAGGGTGAGGVEVLINIAKEWAQTCHIEKKDGPPKVGVIVALPQQSEGFRPARNAYSTLRRLLELAGATGQPPVISPLIVVDNQRIQKIYPNVPVASFFPTANKSISSLFHVFNLLASKQSDLTTFDKQDYEDVLSSGVVSFGATPLPSIPTDPTDISAAIRTNLGNNVLAGGFDLKTGKKAACVVVGDEQLLTQIPQNYLDHGFEMLTRLLSDGSTVHPGIYKGNKPGLAVYSMIGGLAAPATRLAELKQVGGLSDYDE